VCLENPKILKESGHRAKVLILSMFVNEEFVLKAIKAGANGYLPKNTLPLVGEYLAEVKKSDTAGDYIRWLNEKHTVYGYKFTGKWYDIGSLEAYEEAQRNFK